MYKDNFSTFTFKHEPHNPTVPNLRSSSKKHQTNSFFSVSLLHEWAKKQKIALQSQFSKRFPCTFAP